MYPGLKSLKNKYWHTAGFALIILVAYAYFSTQDKQYQSIRSFKECVDAGFPLLETYPEQCKMPGKTFVNGGQIKAETTTKSETDLSKDFLHHSYLIAGTSVLISDSTTTSSSVLTYSGVLYVDSVSNDTLPDTLFLASKLEKGVTTYYLLLALGLYNGSSAPANGIMLGSSTPLSITKDTSGLIQVTFICTLSEKCTKNFMVKNDILEAKE